MLLSLYLISGLAVLGLMLLSLLWPFRRLTAIAKIKYLNSWAVTLSAMYLGITIYAILCQPLPVSAFNNYLYIDSLALYEVLITCMVFLLASIYGHGYTRLLVEEKGLRANSLTLFYCSFALLLVIIILAFFSNNLALFWILLELTTILSAVLIVALSASENIIAALKYVFIASTAMLFSVIGIIILFALTKQVLGQGTLNWSELMQAASALDGKNFIFAFVFVFIGFASKAGIAPFHTWLPQAHARAPSMISAVLSGVLLNCGLYGIIRLFAVAHQSGSWKTLSIMLLVFGLITLAVATFSMLPRSNIKKLLGFSSIEHLGLMLVGFSLATPLAVLWSLFHILAHSLVKTLLFLSAGILNRQYDSNRFYDLKNAFKLQPLASWGLIIGSLAILGLPPFPVFISKLFILTELGRYSLPLLLLVLLLLLIVAGAFAYLMIKAFTQQTETRMEPYKAHWTMRLSLWLLLAAIAGVSIMLTQNISGILDNIRISLGF
jgi:hydrogenase-4 component F